MRLFQVVQVVLVIVVVDLASCDATVASTTNQVASISAPSIVESIRRFLLAEERKPTEERSYNAAVSSGGEGGRVGARVTGVTSTSTTSGGTITITKYWNNGLVQRFKRWLKKLLHPFSSTTRRLRLKINSDCSAGAAKNEIKSTAENFRNLLSFEDVDSESKSTKEERVSAAAKAAAEGGRVGAGDTVVSTSSTGGGTVTVTIYNNNGLWQRIKRWWLSLFSNEERASSGAIASGEGGRAGAGGTVVSTSNGNGGGTVTVTIFNNNGLFQRIVRWWKNVWTHQVAKSTSTSTTTKLRQ